MELNFNVNGKVRSHDELTIINEDAKPYIPNPDDILKLAAEVFIDYFKKNPTKTDLLIEGHDIITLIHRVTKE